MSSGSSTGQMPKPFRTYLQSLMLSLAATMTLFLDRQARATCAAAGTQGAAHDLVGFFSQLRGLRLGLRLRLRLGLRLGLRLALRLALRLQLGLRLRRGVAR
ncbi:unnamed protein product [Prorocentrum cordatum]|uniref:Uncharacterized protein n=1 Tax=Prorocentrum cordatum TaxID=2364126 RepID=A0ABN9XGR5_9DINO|nr:unnamed protein product [Polarella glacialis]